MDARLIEILTQRRKQVSRSEPGQKGLNALGPSFLIERKLVTGWPDAAALCCLPVRITESVTGFSYRWTKTRGPPRAKAAAGRAGLG
jgi:hypothetical protein